MMYVCPFEWRVPTFVFSLPGTSPRVFPSTLQQLLQLHPLCFDSYSVSFSFQESDTAPSYRHDAHYRNIKPQKHFILPLVFLLHVLDIFIVNNPSLLTTYAMTWTDIANFKVYITFRNILTKSFAELLLYVFRCVKIGIDSEFPAEKAVFLLGFIILTK